MKNIHLSIILFLATFTLKAQNSIWSLPPSYVQHTNQGPVNQPLPAPGGTTGPFNVPNYTGLPSAYMHNAMQDAQGDLLFFVIDDMVYDKEGYGICNMASSTPLNGYSELAIVPIPGSCDRFYIISTRQTSQTHQGMSVEYNILDLSILSLSTDRYGVLIDPTPNNGAPGNQQFYEQNVTFPLSQLAPDFSTSFEPEVNPSIAVSELRGDNTRLIFVMGEWGFFRFKASATDIIYDNYSHVFGSSSPTPQVAESINRPEMELITTPSGYRFAMAYKSTTGAEANVLFVADLNTAGDVLAYSYAALAYDGTTFTNADIKGVEFSPNGDYVYITHDPTSINPVTFKIYDIANQNFIPNNLINPQLINDIVNFSNSQIELSGENVVGGRMYLANNTNLATIDNVDDPYNLIWNNAAQTISYQLNTFGGAISLSQHIYSLPDQIDGMDYQESFFINTICCRENATYDVAELDSNHEFYGTLAWDGLTQNNPWNADHTTGVTVKDKMIIKNGANVTINNMIFEFAPEALLIIEDGARLSINGTTLTVDSRCDSNAMWHGVEVWGTGDSTLQTQGGGSFVANAIDSNESVIEHAMEAVCNYGHDLTGGVPPEMNVKTPNSEGGIIQFTDSKLRNNWFGVNMVKYQSKIPSGPTVDDESEFINCNFITDSELNDNSLTPQVHANLGQVNGVLFSGCDFQNTTTGIYNDETRGTGIQSQDAKFRVNARCTTGISPCTSYDFGNFTNLYVGVWSTAVTSTNTLRIEQQNFDDVWRCIIFENLDYPSVQECTFDVGANYLNQSAIGLFLLDCNQYSVNDNIFTTTHNAYIGCYVNNSGVDNNEIYKNDFTNFTIGCQAVLTNGDQYASTGATGLEFRCNRYFNTINYDILIASGEIKAFNGRCDNATLPANNQFSYTAQNGDIWLDSRVTADVSYQYSPGGTNLAPINYTVGTPGIFPTVCNNLPPFDENVSCPTRLSSTVIQLKADLLALLEIVNPLKNQIDGGDKQGLLQIITNNANNGNTKNTLMDASPYLSDEVLLAYLSSNASNEHKKLVLLENSPLTEQVLSEIENSNLPKGIKKQINNEQEGTSARDELYLEIGFYNAEISSIKSEIIRQLLFDNSNVNITHFEDVALFLIENQSNNTLSEQQSLIEALIANEDYNAAQQQLIDLTNTLCVANENFCELNTILIESQQYPEKERVIITNTSLQQRVIAIADATIDTRESVAARILLEEVGLRVKQHIYVPMLIPSNARVITPESEESNTVAASLVVKIYPNPTKEQFTITHNLSQDNGVVNITIYDLMGKVMANKIITEKEAIINVNQLKSGIYFYTITQNNKPIKTDKLLIE